MGAGGTDDWDDMGKSRLEELLPMMKDAQKMMGWLSSNCETAPASGDELETYRRVRANVGMLDTFSMPLVPVSLLVCKSSDKQIKCSSEQITALVMYGLPPERANNSAICHLRW